LFGLDQAYDTNQYTVVRNAATDVRKRIALYYHEPGHEGEIQIELPAGSYMPRFHNPSQDLTIKAASPELLRAGEMEMPAAQTQQDPSVLVPWAKRWGSRISLLFLLAAIFIAIVILAVLVWKRGTTTQTNALSRVADMGEQDRFWKPVLDDSAPEPVILVCVGELPRQPGVNQPSIPLGDALATADFARILGRKDARFRIAVANSVSITDLQAATVLLVGGSDNPWTSYSTEGFRFHFSTKTDGSGNVTQWIEDSKNPAQKDWLLQNSPSSSGSVQDYAIVARAIDPRVGRWRVIAAGLDGTATGVAARLLVDPNYLKELTGHLPADWRLKNIEAVISVPVVNGEARLPHLVAYEVW
jgi:hypothetical protein